MDNRIELGVSAEHSTDENEDSSAGPGATGLRTKRTEGASTTLYLRDGGQVIGEWNGTSWTKEYVWLGSTLLATIEGSTIQYHHQDHLSIRATTFADGMLGEEQGHYPFGEPWYETSPETTRIFTTYEREAGGSLDYAMFRWMGPEAGRFLAADPVHGSLGDGQSWNRYAYAGNDPVNRWDPWGLMQASPYVEVHEVWSNSTGASSWSASFDLFGWKFLFPDWQLRSNEPNPLNDRGARQVTKEYSLETACGLSADELQALIAASFSEFGRLTTTTEMFGIPFVANLEFAGGPLSAGTRLPINVTFTSLPLATPVGMIPPLTHSLSTEVAVVYSGSDRLTLRSVPGHPIYPGRISFQAQPSTSGVRFVITIDGTLDGWRMEVAFDNGGSRFEDSIWNNFLANVEAACSRTSQ
jgi:RHS repeat-associated protein